MAILVDDKNIGHATAYAYAKSKGYTGTEEEFAEVLANAADDLAEVVELHGDVVEKAAAASASATSAAGSASTATTAAGTATTKAGEASDSATAAGTSASQAAASASAANTSAGNASASASVAATSAGSASDSATAAAGSASDASDSAAAALASEQAAAASAQEAQETLDSKANIDGYYEDMTVGLSEQLLATQAIEDKEPYIYRTSGGTADIGDRETDMLVGGTVAWNQLIYANNTAWSKDGVTISYSDTTGVYTLSGTATVETSITIAFCAASIANHIYLKTYSFGSDQTYFIYGRGGQLKRSYLSSVSRETSATGAGGLSILIRFGVSVDGLKFTLNCFDLTQMFGSTIADYIYSLEQTTAGAGVAFFRKLFPEDYYPYDAGTLKSVEGVSAHEMVGFNQWDEEWEVGTYLNTNGSKYPSSTKIRNVNPISVKPNTTYFYYVGSTSADEDRIWCYDANMNFIRSFAFTHQTSIASTFVTPSRCNYINFSIKNTTYNHDICINLSWSGTRNGEYEPYVKHTYSLDSSLTLRGIPKLDASNALYYDGDTYESNGTVTRKYAIVDLGTLDWTYITISDRNYFRARAVTGRKVNTPVVCSKYAYGGDVYDSAMLDAQTGIYTAINSMLVQIKDANYTDATAFKASLSGVYMVYELATPTTETATAYQNPQIVDDWGTEEYVTTGMVPVGHVTEYPANLRDKLQHLPDLADSDGYYAIRQTGTQLYLEPFRIPKAPETDGTYTLKATVSGGTPTYTWEVEA